MPQIRINSLDDPRLEPYRYLKDTNRTRWASLFVCEGEKLVRRLLDSDFSVESVLISDRFERQLADLEPAVLYRRRKILDDRVEQPVGAEVARRHPAGDREDRAVIGAVL